MDLLKAFDTVHHGCLLKKLKCYGINGRELDWFTDYLFNRKQYVMYDGSRSDPKHVIHWVPQGYILGPFLFIILVNDMHVIVANVKCQILMYADDTVLIYADKESGVIQDCP